MSNLERIARMAAKETVEQTFLMLGMDVKDPIATQRTFAFLKNLQHSFYMIKRAAIAAAVGAVVSGLGWVIWLGVKAGAALADKQ